MALMAIFSTKLELLAVLACSSSSHSVPSNYIIHQFYSLVIASTELCELDL